MAATFVAANAVTVIHAGKTIPDMVLSARHGKNCSLLHASRNEPYCQSAPPDPTKVLAELADNRYCYRTLGRIDCYNRPDFLASGHTRVNFAAGYLPASREPAPMAQRQAKGVPMAGIPAPAEAIAGQQAASPAPVPAAKSVPKSPPGGKNAKGTPAAPALAVKAAGEAAPLQKSAMVSPAIAPVLVDPRLTGTTVAQVPPLAALPGQGTY